MEKEIAMPIAGHHEAIISREDFDAAAILIQQRGREKGIVKGKNKYRIATAFLEKSFAANVGIRSNGEYTPAAITGMPLGAAIHILRIKTAAL